MVATSVLLSASAASAQDPAPSPPPSAPALQGLPQLTLGPARDAAADPTPPLEPWGTRPRQLNVVGGYGGPLGFGGLSFEWAPIKYLVLGAGAGFTGAGIGGALLPRLRLPLNRRVAVGLGLPFSLGPYEYVADVKEQCQFAGCSIGFKTTRTWPIAFWGHLEPNVEVRITNALALRGFGGASVVLNDASDRCTSTLPNGCPSQLGERRYYGGLALGLAW